MEKRKVFVLFFLLAVLTLPSSLNAFEDSIIDIYVGAKISDYFSSVEEVINYKSFNKLQLKYGLYGGLGYRLFSFLNIGFELLVDFLPVKSLHSEFETTTYPRLDLSLHYLNKLKLSLLVGYIINDNLKELWWKKFQIGAKIIINALMMDIYYNLVDLSFSKQNLVLGLGFEFNII